ncbi:hypothetical protein Tco_0786799 [Tanacetum coccineum]
MDSGLVVHVFNQRDDPIACLNKAMAFLTVVASSRFPSTNNQLRTSSNLRNQATIQDGRVTVQQVQGRQGQSYACNSYKGNATSFGGNNSRGQAKTEDLDAYDNDCDDVSNAKAVLMANLSNFGSDVISEVPYHEPYHTDMDNQSVHTMQGFEQTQVVDFTDNEITSDSNIISYSQYLQEMQQEAVQDTNLYAQQDSMILSVIEQMSEQMINHVNNYEKANQEKKNESFTAELEKYKEREKLALKQQIDSFEQNLSNHIKEKESLLQTFTIFKNESKEKESKSMDKEIDLEKKIKELDNIIYKKDQRIKPTLYDGSVISSQHVASPVIDDEETLILEELNRLSEDFGNRFVPQQELSNEQTFWLQTSHPNTNQSALSPVKIDAHKELPKTLKDIFNVFDKDLLNEVTEVQIVFNQMEAAVQQYFVDK